MTGRRQRCCCTGIPQYPCCSLPKHPFQEQGVWAVTSQPLQQQHRFQQKSMQKNHGILSAISEHEPYGLLYETLGPHGHIEVAAGRGGTYRKWGWVGWG